MKSKWINLAIACGIAVTFATGCANNRTRQPQPNTRDLLRNRDLVPPPFSSPDAVKGFAPAPSAPAVPGMNAEPRRATVPVAPGNVAYQESPQPALPSDATLFVPAADNGAPAPAVTSLFQDSGSAQPKLVAVTSGNGKGAASSEIINRPVRPATITPSVVKPVVPSPKTGTIIPPGAAVSHPGTSATQTSAPAASQRTVIVKAGDTLSGIAYQYGISWQSLASVNGLTETSKIRIGQKLVLPTTALAKPRAPQAHTQKADQKGKTAGQTTAKPAVAKEGTYAVKAGDSLWTIAKAHNIKFSDIQAWNPSAADKPLKIGQIIIIKAPAGASNKTEAKPEAKAEPKKLDEKQLPKIVTPVQTVPAAPAKSGSADTVIGTGIINVPPAPATQKTDDGAAKPKEEENLLNHNVQEGDTLDKIALMYGANTPAEVAQKVNEIKAKNPTIQSDKDLKVGIIIRVPYTPVLP